jgi:hypothetical protein
LSPVPGSYPGILLVTCPRFISRASFLSPV